MNSLANLLNRKLLVKCAKTNYIAVELNFLTHLLEPMVGQIPIDEAWYVEQYPDVRDAIDQGVCHNAREHYVLHGYYEHRMPYPIRVDEAWYLNEYDDVRQAVNTGCYETGQAHFDELGYREGRIPFPNFSLRSHGLVEVEGQ